MDDWREIRRRTIQAARLVVVKVGSAVLTNEKGLDCRVINRLADQIAALHDRGVNIVLVSSGAVASGRRLIEGRVELKGLPARQAVPMAVWLHGEAGEVCARAIGEYGMTPTDVIAAVPAVIEEHVS